MSTLSRLRKGNKQLVRETRPSVGLIGQGNLTKCYPRSSLILCSYPIRILLHTAISMRIKQILETRLLHKEPQRVDVDTLGVNPCNRGGQAIVFFARVLLQPVHPCVLKFLSEGANAICHVYGHGLG